MLCHLLRIHIRHLSRKMVPWRTVRFPTILRLLLVVVVVVVPVKRVAGIPMKSTIRRDSIECLYDFIEFGYVSVKRTRCYCCCYFSCVFCWRNPQCRMG